MKNKQLTNYPGVYVAETKRKDGKKGTDKAYYVRFKIDGKQYNELAGYSSTNNMTAAKANNYRAQRINGQLQSRKEKNAVNVNSEATIIQLWVKYKATLNKSIASDSSAFKHLSLIENKQPSKITREDILLLHRNDLAPRTNAHNLELLIRMVNFGTKYELCKPLSFRIDKPKVNNIKTECLSSEELATLLKCLDEDYDWVTVGVVKLALFTGMRRGEILSLKWNNINLESGFILLKDPKGGVDVSIPINSITRGLLDSFPRSKSEYVFHNRQGKKREGIKCGLDRLKKAGAFPEGFRPLHGLRHTFASLLASSGKVDMYTLQKLLTHKSPQMTQRYAHLHDDALKKGSSVIDDIFNNG